MNATKLLKINILIRDCQIRESPGLCYFMHLGMKLKLPVLLISQLGTVQIFDYSATTFQNRIGCAESS